MATEGALFTDESFYMFADSGHQPPNPPTPSLGGGHRVHHVGSAVGSRNQTIVGAVHINGGWLEIDTRYGRGILI